MGSRDVGLLQNAAVRLDKKHLDSFLTLITIPLNSTRISRVNSFLKLSIYHLDKKVGHHLSVPIKERPGSGSSPDDETLVQAGHPRVVLHVVPGIFLCVGSQYLYLYVIFVFIHNLGVNLQSLPLD